MQLKELLLLVHTITVDNCVKLSCALADTCYLCFVRSGHGCSATVVLLVGR